ncbi:MAG: hypothetical protein ABI550_01945 [Ignavibacteriaceae bacterium]
MQINFTIDDFNHLKKIEKINGEYFSSSKGYPGTYKTKVKTL